MDNAAIISGYSANLAFAKDCGELINNLKQGKSVATAYWFHSDADAVKCGVNANKFAARLPLSNKSLLEQIVNLINHALEKAMLDQHCLSGENARVYLTGLGPRMDMSDYMAFYDGNDIEDITLNTSICHLHVAESWQDKLAHCIAKKYCLKYSPPNLQCASNSSLSAVHLAIQAIASGSVDLVVVVNCSQITTQDIVFLASQSMLDSAVVQPFGEESKSVLFAEGHCAMVLESARHRGTRGLTRGVSLTSCYTQISSGRGNDVAQISTHLLKVINQVIDKASISVDHLCAILPHANGSEVTDKVEAQAIAALLTEHSIPVLAYKGQIGYTATGSGIIDLIIGHYALCSGELISPVAKGAIRGNIARHLLLNKGIIKHQQQHLLKLGLGVDGSIIAVVMSDHDVSE